MENLGTVLISAILSGIFATAVTIWWQEWSLKRQEKVRIFTVLMANRYDTTSEECVQALNMIDVVFYKSQKVRAAWLGFRDATELPDTEAKGQLIHDRRLKMLEAMAADIGYKNIHWDDIKHYYFPVGLSDQKRDVAMLRRVQIEAAVAQVQGVQDSAAEQVDPKEEFANQMLFKALENPDGLLKLVEVAERAQSLNKGSKGKR